MSAQQDPTPRYKVERYGRSYYVVDTTTGEFTPSVPFGSRKRAQERADEKNGKPR